MKNEDLLIHKKADDKNYLIGKHIKLVNDHLIEMEFFSGDECIYFEDVAAFQSNKVQSFPSLKETLEQNEWLLSMGTIVLFGESVEDAEIPLLERDMFAKADPLRLTCPAGRLDMELSKGCFAELFEEMIMASPSHYFQVDEGACDFAQMQKERIKRMGLPEKPCRILASQPFNMPHTFEVRSFLDGREIDDVKNMFLVVDEANKTLEFRKILLVPKPENLEYLIDGDDFERNIFLFPLKPLAKCVQYIIKPETAILDTLLSSGKNLMPPCAVFMGNKQGKRHARAVSLPVPLLTKTIKEFLLSL